MGCCSPSAIGVRRSAGIAGSLGSAQFAVVTGPVLTPASGSAGAGGAAPPDPGGAAPPAPASSNGLMFNSPAPPAPTFELPGTPATPPALPSSTALAPPASVPA